MQNITMKTFFKPKTFGVKNGLIELQKYREKNLQSTKTHFASTDIMEPMSKSKQKL